MERDVGLLLGPIDDDPIHGEQWEASIVCICGNWQRAIVIPEHLKQIFNAGPERYLIWHMESSGWQIEPPRCPTCKQP